jgi:Chromate transporter
VPLARPSLPTILREWGRIGCIGFGGPPAHVALLRELCVAHRRLLSGEQFEDAIAATNLLPGPGSTQLAIFCAWRLRGVPGRLFRSCPFCGFHAGSSLPPRAPATASSSTRPRRDLDRVRACRRRLPHVVRRISWEADTQGD